MRRSTVGRPLARIVGAVAFGALPLAVVLYDLQGGASLASAAVPLTLLAGIPAIIGAVAFPSALARTSRVHAAALSGAVAFTTLVLVAAVAWLAAKTDASAYFSGWLFVVALGLASPTGIAAAVVVSLLWRRPDAPA